MRFIPTILLLFVAPALAAPQNVPLPRPRPAALGPATPEAAPSEPSACRQQLTAEGVVFAPLPPLVGPGGCGAPDVVRLDAIAMPDRGQVSLVPPPTLRCTLAEAIADWVRQDMGPVAAGLGAPLKSIENSDSYDCRGMNRVAGAKLSEHGKANALDIGAVKLADGRTFRLTDPAVSRDFRERIRETACARFKTVLGPGSDGYHEEHIHVDLAERNHDYRICQWDIREPTDVADVPLPRPRVPIAARAAQ
jgi:hypothetical protein